MFAEDIILKPVLTEKGYDGIASKKYTFYVKKDANKTKSNWLLKSSSAFRWQA